MKYILLTVISRGLHKSLMRSKMFEPRCSMQTIVMNFFFFYKSYLVTTCMESTLSNILNPEQNRLDNSDIKFLIYQVLYLVIH